MKKLNQEQMEMYREELRELYPKYRNIRDIGWSELYDAKNHDYYTHLTVGIGLVIGSFFVTKFFLGYDVYILSFIGIIGIIYGIGYTAFSLLAIAANNRVVEAHNEKEMLRDRIAEVQDILDYNGDYFSKYVIAGQISEKEYKLWNHFKSMRDSGDPAQREEYQNLRLGKHMDFIWDMEDIEKEGKRTAKAIAKSLGK